MKMFNDIFGEWTSVNPDFLLPVKMKWYALHLPLAISTQNGFYLFYRTYSFPVINLLSTLRCRIVVFKHFFPLNHQNIAGFTIWGSFTNWKTEACPQSYSRKSGSCNWHSGLVAPGLGLSPLYRITFPCCWVNPVDFPTAMKWIPKSRVEGK